MSLVNDEMKETKAGRSQAPAAHKIEKSAHTYVPTPVRYIMITTKLPQEYGEVYALLSRFTAL